MMKIEYLTKEESNKIQRDNFLKLAPTERFFSFLNLMDNLRVFNPIDNKIKKKKNFLIEIKDD